jgi:membrane protease YdiL (CAAX protease family)
MVFALITRLFTGEAGLFLGRLKRLVGLYVMLGIFALLLLIFLIIALFTWSAQNFGTLPTALGFAGGALLLVIVTYVMTLMAGRRPSTRADDRLQRDIVSIAGVTAMTNAPQIMRAVRRQKGLLVIPVAAIGMFGLYRILASRRDS